MGEDALLDDLDAEKVLEFVEKMRDLGVKEFEVGGLRVLFRTGGQVVVPGADPFGEVRRAVADGTLDELEAEDLLDHETERRTLKEQTDELRTLARSTYGSSG